MKKQDKQKIKAWKEGKAYKEIHYHEWKMVLAMDMKPKFNSPVFRAFCDRLWQEGCDKAVDLAFYKIKKKSKLKNSNLE